MFGFFGGNDLGDDDAETSSSESEEKKEDRTRLVTPTTPIQPNCTLQPIPSNYPIHAAIICKDGKALKAAIDKLPKWDPLSSHRDRPINALDMHGYTPLTLAVLLSYEEGVDILLKAGASPRVRSANGWSSIQECISTSQRSILRKIFLANMQQMKDGLEVRSPIIREKIAEKEDFYCEIDWKFSSWIPFVSRFCPSDTFRLWKRGSDIRVDMTLIDFNQFKWERGHISFLFKTTKSGVVELHVLNHVEKTRQRTTKSDEFHTDEKEIDDSIEMLLQSDLVSPEVMSDEISITRSTTWLGYPKTQNVSGLDCEVYTLSNLTVLARKRDSHVPEEVRKDRERKKKLFKQKAANGGSGGTDELSVSNSSAAQNSSNNGGRSQYDIEYYDDDDDDTQSSTGVESNPTLSNSLAAPQVTTHQHSQSESLELPSDARQSLHQRTTSSSQKRARSPRPFANSKRKHFENLKRYEYPVYSPPKVTLVDYFNGATSAPPPINSNVSAFAAVDNPASVSNKSGGISSLKGKFTAKMKKNNDNKADSAPPPMPSTENSNAKEKTKQRRSNTADKESDSDTDSDSDIVNDDDNVANSDNKLEPFMQPSNAPMTKAAVKKSIYHGTTFELNPSPVETTSKTFKLNLLMTPHFALTVDEMVTILDAAAPQSRLATKLKEFLQIKMPPGFPVQLELPLYHVLKATVTFQNFKHMKIEEDIFAIPESYTVVEKDQMANPQDE